MKGIGAATLDIKKNFLMGPILYFAKKHLAPSTTKKGSRMATRKVLQVACRSQVHFFSNSSGGATRLVLPPWWQSGEGAMKI